jgi:hypothetical protein
MRLKIKLSNVEIIAWIAWARLITLLRLTNSISILITHAIQNLWLITAAP